MHHTLKNFIAACTMLWINTIVLHAQSVGWIKSIGTNSTDMVTATTLDPIGNSISVLSFTNTISIGTKTFSTKGSTDLLLVKFDRNGNLMWSLQFGSSSNDESRSLTSDVNGNIYVTGNYNGASLDFGTGQLINSISGRNEVFIIKISASGNIIWAKSIQGNGIDNSYRVFTKGSNVLIGGQTTSTTISLDTVSATSSYFRPAWLALLDENGSSKWIRIFGSSYVDAINGITMFENNIFIAGYFSSSSLNFGNNLLNKKGTGASKDIFIASLDLDGNSIWANSYGGTGNEEILDLNVNEVGHLYAGGYFGSSFLLNGTSFNTNQSEQLILFSLDHTGKILWSKTSSNSVNSRIASLSYHPMQGLIAGGYFSGTDLQLSNNTLKLIGGEDGFIITFNKSGTEISSTAIGNDQNERIHSVSIGSCMGIAGGDFMSNSLTFENLTVTNILPGIKDALIARFSYNLNFNLADTIRACGKSAWLDAGAGYNSYNWHYVSKSQTGEAFVSGTYVCEVYNEEGCRGIDSSYVSILNASIINNDTLLCNTSPIRLFLDTSTFDGYSLYSTKQSMKSSWAFSLGYIKDAHYKLTVSGKWSPSTLGNEMMDAAYQFNTITNLSTKKWNGNPPAFLFNGNPIRPSNDVYNPDHQYEYFYTAKANITNLQFNDTYLQDNSGQLNFDFKIYNNPVSIRWSTGEDAYSILVNPTKTTTYYVWITDGITTCMDSVVVKVGAPASPLIINSDPEVNLCEGKTLELSSNAVEEGLFHWVKNNSGYSNEKKAIINSEGNYQLIFTNNAGCADTSELIRVNVLPIPSFKLTYENDTRVCADQPVFNNVIIDDSTRYIYKWLQNGSLIKEAKQSSLQILNSGKYTSIVTSQYGCVASKYFSISITSAEKGIRFPIINTTKGSRIMIEARNIGTSFSWNPMNTVTDLYSRKTIFLSKEGSEITVSINNAGGCKTVDTFSFRVFPKADIIVPNAFTPNNDGKNDRIYPLSIGIRELKQFMIFNRWGKLIFKSSGISNIGWDGMVNGRLSDTGTYVWTATGVLENGELITRQGTFVIIK